jgi:hypothetical protein
MTTLLARFIKQFPGPGSNSTPTPASLALIQEKLGLRLPATLIAVAQACPAYTAWFSSLGEDYQQPWHILNLNEGYHKGQIASFPPHIVIFNLGFDGDCDCFDLSIQDAHGNPSICYCEVPTLENAAVSMRIEHLTFSFDEYLDTRLQFWEQS